MTPDLPKTLPAFIWHFAKPYKWPFLFFLLAPMAMVLEATILPYSLKMIVDIVSTHEGPRENIFTDLTPALWLAAGAWVGMIVIFRLQEWWQCYVLPKFEADIRTGMFAYTTSHSHDYFANNFAGSIANKISDMVNAIRTLSVAIRWHVILTISIVFATLVMMATISPVFSIILCAYVVTNMLTMYPFARKADRLSIKNAEDRSILSGKIVDVFTNAMNMRLFARANYENDYLGQYQDKEIVSNKKLLLTMSNAKFALEIPAAVFFIALLYVLITRWQAGLVTSGDFVFIFYTSFNVMIRIWHLSMEMPTIFKEIGVAKQALSIITPPHGVRDKTNADDLTVTRGEIVFDRVHFQYRAGKDIFRDKNITIKAGEKIGLVGFSGSGKSTFVNLLLRFYDIDGGRILIDGQDIADVTQDSLRRNIAMIPQDTSLFHRSLMENIRYGRLNATDDDAVIAASKKAYCHDFIQDMPDQYDALVGERGVKLSGGQRQRIAVARAILKDAPVLILDEATSSLDSLTEEHIQASLRDLMEERTTIVIAHRLSTLSDMDRILVFRDGEIIEDGAHDDLLTRGGHYETLWTMQVGGFLPEKCLR